MIDIIAEPTGDVYASLLAFARTQCATFSLVWRNDLPIASEAHVVSASLANDLIGEGLATEWPGTRVLDEPRLLRRYRFSATALDTLVQAPGLYSWCAPARPEDLALYAGDGSVWLGSIAHERDAFLGQAMPSRDVLLSAVPGLRVRERGGS